MAQRGGDLVNAHPRGELEEGSMNVLAVITYLAATFTVFVMATYITLAIKLVFGDYSDN